MLCCYLWQLRCIVPSHPPLKIHIIFLTSKFFLLKFVRISISAINLTYFWWITLLRKLPSATPLFTRLPRGDIVSCRVGCKNFKEFSVFWDFIAKMLKMPICKILTKKIWPIQRYDHEPPNYCDKVVKCGEKWETYHSLL